jgi:flagella basal body P-ring formation protein FlgA
MLSRRGSSPSAAGRVPIRGVCAAAHAARGAQIAWWFLAAGLLLAQLVAASAAGGAVPGASGERREAAAQAILSFRSESTVRGPIIRLGEIADIQTRDAALAQRLRRIEVGRAPLPGLSRTLDVAYIQIRLRLEQIDPGALAFDAPPTLTVTAASQRVTGADLVAAVRQAILAARQADAGTLSVQDSVTPPDLVLPMGSVELKVGTRFLPSQTSTVAVPVEAWVDGVSVRSVSVPVRISALFPALVAVRPIGRHAVLLAEDVRVERREILAGQEALREPGAVIGRRAVRNIAAGELVLEGLVELPPLVRRGEMVLLVAEGHGVRAEIRGEAREEGKAGQVVRVRNLISGREVYGQVQAEGVVRVPF